MFSSLNHTPVPPTVPLTYPQKNPRTEYGGQWLLTPQLVAHDGLNVGFLLGGVT